MKSKIMVVDDEMHIRELVRFYLDKAGFDTIEAANAEEALDIVENQYIDLAVVDIMMPGMDGFELVEQMRQYREFPVIMLTAKSQSKDKLRGFSLGIDDYVTKPFDAKEVMARVKAVLRRASGSNDAEENSKKIVKYDNLEINIVNYELKVKGVPVDTPPKELELIYHFASNPNRVYTRDQLLDEVWGFDYYGDSRTVDVHVKRLREKLEGVSDKWSLKTVWGVGYKFETKE